MEERVEAMLDSNVTNSELKLLTEKFNKAMREGKCDVDTKFQYAVTLSRSRLSADHHRAITLLEDLCVSGDPEAFRDYLFYLIIVNIKLHVCILSYSISYISIIINLFSIGLCTCIGMCEKIS